MSCKIKLSVGFQITELTSFSKYKKCSSDQLLKVVHQIALYITGNGQVCKMGKLIL